MYKIATQRKFRFPSNRGELTVEQLFDLPLSQNDGFDLDTVARTINSEIKSQETESFVDEKTVGDEILRLKLEIVKDVIKTKKAEIEEREQLVAKRQQQNKLRRMIKEKEEQQLSSSTLEELQAKLDALD